MDTDGLDPEKTAILIEEAMVNAGLELDEARKVSRSFQYSKDAVVRFEAIEEELTNLAAVFKQGVKVGKFLIALLAANFAGDISELLGLV